MAEALDEIWAWLVNKILEFALGTLRTLLTWWMSDTAYSVQLSGEKSGVLYYLREHLNWLTFVMAFAGFLVTVIRVAVQRKGEPFRAALSQFFELAVLVFTLATAVNLANMVGDKYSAWVLPAEDDDWVEKWKSGIELLGGHEADSAFILLFFALAALIATTVQFGLLLFRSGILIVLIAVLPSVAAARFTAYGERAYRICIGWVISWTLYKSVAATIYSGALTLMASDNEADRLFGLALVAGAIFAYPATARCVMPAVADDHRGFGVRQVGHFVFGSSAVNAGKLTTPASPGGLLPSGVVGGAARVVGGVGGAAIGVIGGAGRMVGRALGRGGGDGGGGTAGGAQGGGGSGSGSGGSGGVSGSSGAASGSSGAASGGGSGTAGGGSGGSGGSAGSGSPGSAGPNGSQSSGPSGATAQSNGVVQIVDPPDFSSIGGTRDGGMPPPPNIGDYDGPTGSNT